ncbi:hypothetical protein MWN33_10840 [Starkeya koreensis]|uniref:Uncharacterized protein n=1 Tax=Ancylobacter koreensis TaxID=266121 RepID=A0ABT0DML9_9HYPH|nr:hypothetical protein [Ancylobacter koreensis]MCK0208527.1 hypothetical protein [Ancylobacter koreensis]
MTRSKHMESLARFLSLLAQRLGGRSSERTRRREQERAIALIRASDLFDGDWYLAKYPDVAAASLDPARHYLLHGWREGRNPGPRFSSKKYLALHAGLAGVNPLLDHILRGEPGGIGTERKLPREPADVAALLEIALDASGPHVVGTGGADAADDGMSHFVLGTANLGRGRPDDPAVRELRRQIDLLLELSGQPTGALCHRIDDEAARFDWCGPSEDTPFRSPQPNEAATLAFASPGAPRIADAWFAGARVLRLRLDAGEMPREQGTVTALQWAPDGRHERSATLLAGAGADFLDIRLANPLLPLLLVLTTPSGRIRASTLLPFPSLCRGGLHDGEALAVGDGRAGLDAVRHAGASLLAGLGPDGLHPRIDWIDVDLTGATGAERLFSRDLRAWLADVAGVGIRPRAVEADEDREEAGRDGAGHAGSGAAWLGDALFLDAERKNGTPRVLHLAADSVPTLHAVFGARECGTGPAPFVLCHGPDATPAWLIAPPGTDLPREARYPGRHQPFPRFAGPGASAPEGSAPAALRLAGSRPRDPKTLIAPVALSRPIGLLRREAPPRLSALLRMPDDPALAAGLLEALANQADVTWSDINVVAEAAVAVAVGPQVRNAFPGVGRVAAYGAGESLEACLDRAAAQAEGELLLVLGSPVLLHDHRTLASLAGMLVPTQIASAACTLIAPAPGPGGEAMHLFGTGCYTSQEAVLRTNSSHRYLQESLAGLPPTAWPVPANTTAMFLARRCDWAAYGGFEPGDEGGALATRFWEATAAAGRLHLATTALTATIADPAGRLPAPTFQSAAPQVAMTVRRIAA